ncbi:MAG: CRTAC1 family protein, partial [Terriglobales bacterium]
MTPRLTTVRFAALALATALALLLPALGQAPSRPARPDLAFLDVTRAAGLDFHLTCGGAEKRYIMESLCGGVAFLDFDNDGWLDIFLVKGST